MTMVDPVITIRIGPPDGDHAVIGWDGSDWFPVSDSLGTADSLCRTARQIAAIPLAGSHHFPPGVAEAQEVAIRLGGRILTCPKWPSPLPEGVVS